MCGLNPLASQRADWRTSLPWSCDDGLGTRHLDRNRRAGGHPRGGALLEARSQSFAILLKDYTTNRSFIVTT
jgi:hypothetical protein